VVRLAGGRWPYMPAIATTPVAASGSATGEDAVVRAVAQAVAGVRSPGLVVFFPTAEIEDAGSQAADAAGVCPTAGMTVAAVLSEAGSGCSAMAFDDALPAGVGVSEHASADPATAALEATTSALANVPVDSAYRLVMLFSDTRSGDMADVVAGAYRAAGPLVPLAGGGAGGDEPRQFSDGRALRDSVVAVAIGSPRPIGLGVSDGCSPVGVPSIVTRANGRVLLELDGRPAAQVYLEKLGAGARQMDDSELARFAVLHPLAQPELSGDRRLRHVLGRTGDGGLHCATTVPPHAAVEFTAQDPELVVRSSWDAVSNALMPLGGEPASAAIVFDCAGRKRALSDDLGREVDTLRSSFGKPLPMAGGYTHGEIGRARGAKGDRNHAVVVVAIG